MLALRLEPRRAALIVVGGGALALAALFAIDLVLGGAHLSRSVLGAGEAGDVLDVLDRRVTLMVHTFTHPVYPELLAVCAVLLIAAAVRRQRRARLVRRPLGGAQRLPRGRSRGCSWARSPTTPARSCW